MQINAGKIKLMANDVNYITANMTIGRKKLMMVQEFKYLGASMSEEESKSEICSRTAQAVTVLAWPNGLWWDSNITLKCKF